MFCKNCGFEILENAAFCPECGTKVEAETVVEETTVCEASVAEEEAVVTEETLPAVEDVTAEPAQEEVCDECTCCAEAEGNSEVEQETCAQIETEAEASFEQSAADYGFESQEIAAEPQAPAKKSNKLLISLVAVVLMVVLAVGAVFVVPRFFGGNYEEVAINYSIAYAEGDLVEASKYAISNYVEVYDRMIDYSCEEYEMSREEFFELLSEQYGATITSVEQLFDVMKEEAQTYINEEFGTYTISAKVVEAEEMTESDFAELIDYIKEDQGYDYPSVYTDIDAGKIDTAYDIEVELVINGAEKTETETENVIVVKYEGKWKTVIQ